MDDKLRGKYRTDEMTFPEFVAAAPGALKEKRDSFIGAGGRFLWDKSLPFRQRTEDRLRDRNEQVQAGTYDPPEPTTWGDVGSAIAVPFRAANQRAVASSVNRSQNIRARTGSPAGQTKDDPIRVFSAEDYARVQPGQWFKPQRGEARLKR